MGVKSPFVETRAVFVMGDEAALEVCQDACGSPWDNCCDTPEKIKAIGDAYMVASGLPNPRPDHASALVHLARDFFDILDRFNAERGLDLSLRVGISCGPITAGIIGKHKFAYDIWGDTVNVASRMESTGVPGRIQVTEAFVDATRGEFQFEPRDALPIKGKGTMKTWLLVGPV